MVAHTCKNCSLGWIMVFSRCREVIGLWQTIRIIYTYESLDQLSFFPSWFTGWTNFAFICGRFFFVFWTVGVEDGRVWSAWKCARQYLFGGQTRPEKLGTQVRCTEVWLPLTSHIGGFVDPSRIQFIMFIHPTKNVCGQRPKRSSFPPIIYLIPNAWMLILNTNWFLQRGGWPIQ